MRQRPTIAYLRQCLAYDPALGLVWLHRPREHFGSRRAQIVWNGRWAGEIAGSICTDGYRQIKLAPFLLSAAHVVWALKHGAWPDAEVDHRNGIRDDDDDGNLRPATHAENAQNRKTRADSSTGLAGVTPFQGKYQSRITINGRRHFLGAFDTAEEAHLAYLDAKARLHPFQPALRLIVGG